MLQSARASTPEIAELKDDLKKVKDGRRQSHSYYIHEWTAISSHEEKAVLKHWQNNVTVVICADYQMAKLVPCWGLSAQQYILPAEPEP